MTEMLRSPRPLLVLLAIAVVALVPAGAQARGGGRPEARSSGSCGHGASSWLRLRSRDGAIELVFEVDERHAGRVWRVVLVQEARVRWRGHARTTGRSGSFSLERRLANLPGADQVTARAVGPGGLTCQATARLVG